MQSYFTPPTQQNTSVSFARWQLHIRANGDIGRSKGNVNSRTDPTRRVARVAVRQVSRAATSTAEGLMTSQDDDVTGQLSRTDVPWPFRSCVRLSKVATKASSGISGLSAITKAFSG